jgi:hypothetical protein
MVKAATLVGELGDIFWSLPPALTYVAGSEIHCRIYVANPTDVDRNYMMMARLSRGDEVLAEFPIKVDQAAWFPVEAGSVISLPGALVLSYSDVALTVYLYEEETNEITDMVSTALSSAGTAQLPILPGLPQIPAGLDWMSLIGMVMAVAMLGIVMPKMLEE